jgi:molybdopterin-synthase adenylyltransferase
MSEQAEEPVHDRYIRQTRFAGIGRDGQQRLSTARVAILGLGALGSVIANGLARAGVGYLRLIDRDIVDITNLHRQILFTEEDAQDGRPKSVASADHLRRANSSVVIDAVVDDIDATNIERLIENVDLVMDGTDNFETRFLINDACVKNQQPWVHGGAIGSYGITLTIVPGHTACLACVLNELPAPGSTETCATAGVLSATTGVVANMQVAEALKLLVGAEPRTSGMIIDVWQGYVERIVVARNRSCPVCAEGRFEHLVGAERSRVRLLCGSDSIQIIPAGHRRLDLGRMEASLRAAGTVRRNNETLRLKMGTVSFTLFPDGRAMIRGVRDENEARALYAELVGL